MSYMENSLREPLGEILPAIQKGILEEGRYFGVPMWKFPGDALEILNIIYAQRPTLIIELGTKYGGFTLMMAHYLDQMNHGRIVSVDIDHTKVSDKVKDHSLVKLITGDAEEVFPIVRTHVTDEDYVMVLEDTSHQEDHVLRLLRKYSPLVSPGQYYIVEDGIINHGLVRNHPGPYPAVEQFLRENKEFESKRSHEKFFITWNPNGFLRRKIDLK